MPPDVLLTVVLLIHQWRSCFKDVKIGKKVGTAQKKIPFHLVWEGIAMILLNDFVLIYCIIAGILLLSTAQ